VAVCTGQDDPSAGETLFFETEAVPIHAGQDLGRGLLKKILRDIEMSFEEFSVIHCFINEIQIATEKGGGKCRQV